MKTTFVMVALASGLLTTAQPTINLGIYGAIGDTISFQQVIFASVTAGASGANVTWDFSGAIDNGSPISSANLDPAITPYWSDFPDATISTLSFSGASYGYYKVTPSKAEFLGLNGSLGYIIYDNPETLNEFPATFSTTHTDAFHAYGLSTAEFERMGTNSVTIDAYGTLITPSGTFPNCVRLHFTQSYSDTFPAFQVGSQYTNDQYIWYSPSYPGALMSMSTLTSYTIGGTIVSEVAGYNPTPKAVTGMDGMRELSFIVAPNPATDFVLIQWPADAGAERVQVFNPLGELVQQESATGLDNMILDLRHLPIGCYHVLLQTRSASRSVRLVKS